MTSFQTFETTGMVDENGVLQVEPFVGVPAGQVRVWVFVPEATEASLDYDDSEPTSDELTAMSQAILGDWKHPAEDFYSWDEAPARTEEPVTTR